MERDFFSRVNFPLVTVTLNSACLCLSSHVAPVQRGCVMPKAFSLEYPCWKSTLVLGFCLISGGGVPEPDCWGWSTFHLNFSGCFHRFQAVVFPSWHLLSSELMQTPGRVQGIERAFMGSAHRFEAASLATDRERPISPIELCSQRVARFPGLICSCL